MKVHCLNMNKRIQSQALNSRMGYKEKRRKPFSCYSKISV